MNYGRFTTRSRTTNIASCCSFVKKLARTMEVVPLADTARPEGTSMLSIEVAALLTKLTTVLHESALICRRKTVPLKKAMCLCADRRTEKHDLGAISVTAH